MRGVAGSASSGFSGVVADGELWKVQLTVRSKNIFLGKYHDPEVAAFIYDEARAALNFMIVPKNSVDPKLITLGRTLSLLIKSVGANNVAEMALGLDRIFKLSERID